MSETSPIQSASIEGATAHAMALVRKPDVPRNPTSPREVMSVKTAADIDKAMGDPENQHHCPLCNNEFGTTAFAAHAPDCIDKYVPRQRMWFPPGVTGVMQSYSEERPRRPGGGIYGGY